MFSQLFPSCQLCGQLILFQFLQTPLNEVFCTSHQDLPQCKLCLAPFLDRPDGDTYCSTCATGSLTDQAAVKAALPTIRAELRSMGIALTHRVRVRLVSESDIAKLGGRELGVVGGLTTWSGQSVVDITIVAGLPPAKFGMTVAHETMHAWMVQEGFATMPPIVAEGLCPLAAFRWLKNCTHRGAEVLSERIKKNADPVYGDGFRAVRESVKQHGLSYVLAVVKRTGQLP